MQYNLADAGKLNGINFSVPLDIKEIKLVPNR